MSEIKVIDNNFDKTIWNSVAKHPLQSWEWGELRLSQGIKILRLAEYKDDALQNVYLLTLEKLPIISKYSGYLALSDAPSEECLQFLKTYSQEKGIIFIKIEPDIFIEPDSDRDLGRYKDLKILPSSHSIFHEWTYVVDLESEEEQLLQKMKQKTRYNIRLAEKKGVMVKEVQTEEEFKDFTDLYEETCRRQQYNGPGYEYHKKVWLATRSSMSKILVSYYEGKPLAAFELFYFNDILYYPYGGTSTEFRNVMAPNLLMWEAMKLGKQLGAKSFDMWGINPPEENGDANWSGFSKFKEGYGGEYKKLIGSFDLVINTPLYWLYSYAFRLKQYLKSKK
jgi:peptidoglycan pentaglycine glycine transferase (the first glycine)